VKHICQVLEVSRTAYYQWSCGQCSLRDLADRELSPLVRNVFLQHRRRYGARRIAVELQSMG
jgi:putative transposase